MWILFFLSPLFISLMSLRISLLSIFLFLNQLGQLNICMFILQLNHYRYILEDLSQAPISTQINPLCSTRNPSHLLPKSPVIISDLDLPITLRKDKQSMTAHPIFHFIFYDHFTPSFHQFALSLSFVFVPKYYIEVLDNPAWKAAIDEKMVALLSRDTWDLIDPPTSSKIVGYRWVFIIKYKLDGTVQIQSQTCC